MDMRGEVRGQERIQGRETLGAPANVEAFDGLTCHVAYHEKEAGRRLTGRGFLTVSIKH